VNLERKWQEFVCDPSRPGRFLSNVGRSVSSKGANDIDPGVLKDFLERLSGGGADVELLAAAVELAKPEYVIFFSSILSPLLDTLANERVGEAAVVGPGLRGNPLWSSTSVARKSGTIPRTHFVSRLPLRSFALPENMLVRWLVGSVLQTIELLESRLGSSALPDRFAIIRQAAKDAFAHHWFAQVEPPRLATSEMLRAAKRQRNSSYRRAAALAEERVARAAGNPISRWLKTLDLLRANWLAPEKSDDLFELYTLILVLDILEKEFALGQPQEFGLAIPGRTHVALFKNEAVGTIRVFFDQSPNTVLGERSRYKEIVAAHVGTLGRARRPDVVVARFPPDGTRPIVMFFETKESRDTSYTSDSIYKALGYAFDYLSLWDLGPACPKVALIFPQDIFRRAEHPLSSLDVTLVSSMDRGALRDAMSARLGIETIHVGESDHY
jgi:hypothetical protein